jgi:hypothetical protein
VTALAFSGDLAIYPVFRTTAEWITVLRKRLVLTGKDLLGEFGDIPEAFFQIFSVIDEQVSQSPPEI